MRHMAWTSTWACVHNMCARMCVDMFTRRDMDRGKYMCTEMYVHMCIDVYTNMCADMCIDSVNSMRT